MFRLHKWYLDVVTDQGIALILYSARVEWGRLALDYASVLHCADGPLRESRTVHRVEHPQRRGNSLLWRNAPLQIEGRWDRDARAIRRTLLKGPDGAIRWTCHMPRARATVRCGNQQIAGLGYVESLDLTVSPAKLPFHTLRWGRHLSREHALVWIDWTGDTAHRWVWLDGHEQSHATFAHDVPSCIAEGTTLQLSNTRDVHNRPVIGALDGLPSMITRRIAGGLGRMHEHKQVSQSAILAGGCVLDSGWSLHEVVTR